jgi:hypothetical protein
MLELENVATIGIDSAGKPENPTGWTLWKKQKGENKQTKSTQMKKY